MGKVGGGGHILKSLPTLKAEARTTELLGLLPGNLPRVEFITHIIFNTAFQIDYKLMNCLETRNRYQW